MFSFEINLDIHFINWTLLCVEGRGKLKTHSLSWHFSLLGALLTLSPDTSLSLGLCWHSLLILLFPCGSDYILSPSDSPDTSLSLLVCACVCVCAVSLVRGGQHAFRTASWRSVKGSASYTWLWIEGQGKAVSTLSVPLSLTPAGPSERYMAGGMMVSGGGGVVVLCWWC